jgi:4-hydroxy-2-oxoheptanedioate aldolase
VAHKGLEAAWSASRCAFGGWVTTSAQVWSEAYGDAGYDYVAIDCQHTAVGEAEAAAMIRGLHAAPWAVFARVSCNDTALIGRLADAGADGVIIPMVSTAADAAAAVASCRYPPHGVRSFGPARAKFGSSPKEFEDRVSCFAMVETAKGLDDIEEICAVPGLAGIYVGPADLSLGLGLDPWHAFDTDQLMEPVARIRQACDDAGLIFGIHAIGVEDAIRQASRGARLISMGMDVAIFAAAVSRDLAAVRAGTGG